VRRLAVGLIVAIAACGRSSVTDEGPAAEVPMRASPPETPPAAWGAPAGGEPAPAPAPRDPAPLPDPPERGIWFEVAPSGVEHDNLSGPHGTDKRYLLDCIGQGVATLDVDGDGRLDLYFAQGRARPDVAEGAANLLYRNRGARRFERWPGAAGAAEDGYSFGALAFDLESDGDEDLLVTNLGPDRLYRNDGGRFTDATTPAVAGDPAHWSTGAAAGDVDRDGDLDVYVCSYFLHDGPALDARGPCLFMGCRVPCGPLSLTPQPDRFLRNDDGTLVDATAPAGLDREPSFGFQPVFSDVDDDGDLDLYVSNDSEPNWLFANDGSGRFTEEGLAAGVSYGRSGQSEAGMGVAVGDVDGDRLPEIYVTNFSSQVNALYRNFSTDRLLWFEEVAHRAAIGSPTFFKLSWGCAFADFDRDGLTDVFVANGHVYPQVDGCPPPDITYAQPNSLFAGRPGGEARFLDLGPRAGAPFAAPAGHRGSAVADLDDDGAPDLVVVRLDRTPIVAWNASRGAGHWLTLTVRWRPRGEGPFTHAVGARATFTAGARTWTREVQAGSGFLGTEDPRLHVGLGEAARLDRLAVRFPDGTRFEARDVAADRHLVLRFGADEELVPYEEGP